MIHDSSRKKCRLPALGKEGGKEGPLPGSTRDILDGKFSKYQLFSRDIKKSHPTDDSRSQPYARAKQARVAESSGKHFGDVGLCLCETQRERIRTNVSETQIRPSLGLSLNGSQRGAALPRTAPRLK